MTMDYDPRISLLAYLTQQITLYCPIIIIAIGTIGCFCNFITFTSLKLRKNSCSLYFLCAAVFDLLTLDLGTLTKLLVDHFGCVLFNQVQIYCKIRIYFINVFPAIATCFIVLAAMDRYMSTSSKLIYRSFATIKYAKWIIPLSLIICILSYIHYPIFSDLRPTCSLQPGAYSMFTVVYSIVWTSFIPHFLMLYFGFGTLYHIRVVRRRIIAANNQQRRIERTETQLVTVSQLLLYLVDIHLCSNYR
jgi:hypothetical protein